MNPVLKNILGVIVGLIVGSIVNGGLIMLGPSIFPLPEGVNPMDAQSLADNIERFSMGNFAMVFLAHALGTLVGSLIAVKIAGTHKAKMAYIVGGLFLIGGIMNAFTIPAPTWFISVDLILAYIPMAWIATKTA